MYTQSVFQAGNSQVVAIPKDLALELGIRVGQKVGIERLGDSGDVVIRTNPQALSAKKPDSARKEFKAWLDRFLDEDEALLNELAGR